MREREGGFTLIELMIAVVIIGILASIAYPTYTRYVQEARRTDAHAKLMEIAGRLERCYTVNSSYQNCVTGLGAGIDTEEEFYKIAGNVSDSSYTLTATTTNAINDAQVADSCDNFTLSHTGAKGASGNDCW
ncbi:MAG: type IV pilin protein [Halomonas sp.]|nr:type IV pilin protein [Halomonas sp.]